MYADRVYLALPWRRIVVIAVAFLENDMIPFDQVRDAPRK